MQQTKVESSELATSY